MTKHSRPWQANFYEAVLDAHGTVIEADDPEVRAYCLRAVNAHDDLLAACMVAEAELAEWDKQILDVCSDTHKEPRTSVILRALRAAIAKAVP